MAKTVQVLARADNFPAGAWSELATIEAQVLEPRVTIFLVLMDAFGNFIASAFADPLFPDSRFAGELSPGDYLASYQVCVHDADALSVVVVDVSPGGQTNLGNFLLGGLPSWCAPETVFPITILADGRISSGGTIYPAGRIYAQAFPSNGSPTKVAEITFSVAAALAELTISLSPSGVIQAAPGELVRFRATVTNVGGVTATGVRSEVYEAGILKWRSDMGSIGPGDSRLHDFDIVAPLAGASAGRVEMFAGGWNTPLVGIGL